MAHAEVSNISGGNGDEWVADPRRVHVELEPSGVGARQIRHARYPFVGYIDAKLSQEAFQDALFEIASRYVEAANGLLKLPAWVLPVLPGEAVDASVAWTPFASDLRSSFMRLRFDDPDTPKDPIAVNATILASLGRGDAEDGFQPFYGGQGLRVIGHIGFPHDGRYTVRLTSVSHTLPRWDREAKPTIDSLVSSQILPTESGLGANFGFLVEYVKEFPRLFNLDEGAVPIETGFEIVVDPDTGKPEFLLHSKTARSIGQQQQSEAESMPESTYRVTSRLSGFLEFEAVSKLPLITHATADVLPRDPVTAGGPAVFGSTRPFRADPAFDPYVQRVPLVDADTDASGNTVLKDTNNRIAIRTSVLVAQPSTGDVVTVPNPSKASPRSNEFAAVNAYVRGSEFMARLLSYGMNPETTLKYLTLPLTIYNRGGIKPGAMDGQTVNAQVRWLSNQSDIPNAAQPGTAEVSFALADLRISPASHPLGIAADARWAWHEWCHVMLAGCTGVLEFEFAHSAGDALAAIIFDPDSELAQHKAWRGVTFPWVTIPGRHHDRDVRTGWGWAGYFHQHERYFTSPQAPLKQEPYWTEQIQSSSLFQMYRSLGGDAMTDGAGPPTPDRPYRKAIADYSVFLILEAIRSIGSSSTMPAHTPDDFVTLLEAADTGNPKLSSGGMDFIGGTAGKVIRWAYQQQGLYPDPAKKYPVNEAGIAPLVDLYIEDSAKRKGGYAPLAYYNDDWHADTKSMLVVKHQADHTHQKKVKKGTKVFLKVFVNNCGRQVSDVVTVRAWVGELNAGEIPPWKDGAWTALTQVAAALPPVVQPGGTGGPSLSVFEWTPAASATKYALFAEATSTDDRSNIDPATGHYCATVAPGGDASPMPYLVGCDNNLGLIVVSS